MVSYLNLKVQPSKVSPERFMSTTLDAPVGHWVISVFQSMDMSVEILLNHIMKYTEDCKNVLCRCETFKNAVKMEVLIVYFYQSRKCSE